MDGRFSESAWLELVAVSFRVGSSAASSCDNTTPGSSGLAGGESFTLNETWRSRRRLDLDRSFKGGARFKLMALIFDFSSSCHSRQRLFSWDNTEAMPAWMPAINLC